ncbi:MAG: hypothetical protein JST73_09070, partial [Actinobacteria bacterium]|nr:hypothetical protein [Actinomycetota bacterium]
GGGPVRFDRERIGPAGTHRPTVIRPFRGRAPIGLVLTGLFRALLYVTLAWAVFRAATGERTAGDVGTVARLHGTFIALGIVFVAGVVVNVARVAVGIMGLTSTHWIDGTVTEVRPYRRGESIPAPLRRLFGGRGPAGETAVGGGEGDASESSRAVRHLVTVDTADGERSFIVTAKRHKNPMQGRAVRVAVSGPNEYVRRIIVTDDDGDRPRRSRFRRKR